MTVGTGRIGAGLALFVSLVLVAAIAAVDDATGPRYSFAAFYILPIGLAAWRGGEWAGLAAASAAATLWFWVDVLGTGNPRDPERLWNGAAQGALFLLAALLLSTLRERVRREKILSRTDPATGAANSRAFQEAAEREIDRARRSGRPFTSVYLDVDDFKRVNDHRGHSAGDALLARFAATLSASSRSIDLVARLGGDEFGILLPETDREGAAAYLEKIRSRLRESIDGADGPVTCSIGAVTWRRPPADVGEMIRRADGLMYRVKAGAKDGVAHEVE